MKFKIAFPLLLLLITFISCSSSSTTNPVINVITRAGDFQIELLIDKAPITATHFLKLVKQKAYNKASFYRVVKAEDFPSDYNTGVIQGGIYLTGKTLPPIAHESTKITGLSNTDGIVSMARTEAGTASTEFFICVGDQSVLDAGRRGTADSLGMAAFGKVISGMKVVKKILNRPSNGDRLVEPIEIQKISVN
ncbi:MAG: peptidylprolyl isomerase [Ferruginibacter sp.]|nr:peptidylprolyl isomerase [Ferruginibacter sp.]